MRKTPIYLDNNATTPLRAGAVAAMNEAMGPPANPSSVHSFGRNARLIVEKAREAVAIWPGAVRPMWCLPVAVPRRIILFSRSIIM
jgi:cysteine sulfinate desulfinase/cysteine desulfurase-like protein